MQALEVTGRLLQRRALRSRRVMQAVVLPGAYML